MKSRETKQNDLNALTESLQNSTSAMVVSFTKLTVTKDQEFRSSLREVGANYQVVKNTLARIAIKGTQFEDATEHFKGVTALAWTDGDPVVLSKAISKFMKANADIYTFKTGVVDGRLVDLKQLNTIANLPSKEELISKLLWVINSSAQGLVTVINAVPRDIAVVIKQIGESKPAAAAPAPAVEVKAEETVTPTEEAAPPADESPVEADSASEEAAPEVVSESTEGTASADETPVEAAPATEEAASEEAASEEVAEPTHDAPAQESEADAEATAAEPDDSSEQVLEPAPLADDEEKAG